MNFLSQLTKIINTGQSRSVILTGNIYDLFEVDRKWYPLMNFLQMKCKVERKTGQKGITQIIYQVNRPLEVIGDDNMTELENLWRINRKDGKTLKERFAETANSSILALELLRQITEIARLSNLQNNLLIIIESADMLLPQSELSRMMSEDRKRIGIVQDWFGDPDFVSGHDTVIFISESRNGVHSRISKLPQVTSIDIPLPDKTDRYQFMLHHPAAETYKGAEEGRHTCSLADLLADQTSGLSIHACNQLLRSGDYSPNNINAKVEEYMISQLGEGVIEFKRPTHTLDDVIGFSIIKAFIEKELIPGFKSGEIAGALAAGPIGGGKTYLCEAVAAMLGIPVILLKNIRSKWYGETDEIFEKLRRLVESFSQVMIFVDEADTMFGGVDSEQDTERRLTGKIQAMMSDLALRGKVIWFLMTARPHKLSSDIRRPGRMDLIIPILDPEGEDQIDFIKWAFGNFTLTENEILRLCQDFKNKSSASYAMMRKFAKRSKTLEEALKIIEDVIDPDIAEVREYQTLQALLNCTRKSLNPVLSKLRSEESFTRKDWKKRIAELEAQGIH